MPFAPGRDQRPCWSEDRFTADRDGQPYLKMRSTHRRSSVPAAVRI